MGVLRGSCRLARLIARARPLDQQAERPQPRVQEPGTPLELAGLVLLGMLAFAWAGVLLGMLVRSPDAMQGVGFTVIFPLSFMAGVFVPIAGMALIPRTIAQWDPISALVAATRELTTRGVHVEGSWQLDHPEVAMALWCLIVLIVCVPLALRRFGRTLAA